MKLKIDDIIILERIREDIGDISPLKNSMRIRGMINPVIIDRNNALIAGYRRITAARELGWDTIECRVIDVPTELDKIMLEADENIGRKDFTSSELKKYRDRKEYLSAGTMKRVKLKLIMLLNTIKEWFRRTFLKKD